MPVSLLITITTLAWGCWSIAERLAVRSASPWTVQVLSGYIYAAVSTCIYLVRPGSVAMPNASAILWTACACGLATVASFAFQVALLRTSAAFVTATTATYPMITMLVAWMVLGEAVTWRTAVGIAVTVAGVVILSV